MVWGIGLCIGEDCQWQQHLARNLEDFKIELHSEPSISTAKKKLQKQSYDFVLIQFDSADEELFFPTLASHIQTSLFNNNRQFPHGTKKKQILIEKETIVDFDSMEVYRNGTVCKLRGLGSDLLKYFLDNPGRIVSREELRQCPIWADSICSSAKEGGKTFDMAVGKLRGMIEADPSRPQIIVSIRGRGWMLKKDAIIK